MEAKPSKFRRRDAFFLLVALMALYERYLTMRPGRFLVQLREEVLSSVHDQEANALSSSSSLTHSSRNIQNAIVSEPTHQKQKDWFRHQEWQDNPFTEKCWHVEDVCHSTHRWFYNPLSNVPQYQPPFTIDFSLSENEWTGRPSNITVQAPNLNMTIRGKPITSIIHSTCTHSPIPNHLVLHALSNDMLGEFYSRTIPWLHLIQKSITKSANQSNPNSSDGANDNDADNLLTSSFLEQTQMYLHIPGFPQHGKMLDSQHIFTETFRSNPLLSVTSLLDNSRCRCLKRLILCGYDDAKGKSLKSSLENTSLNTSTTTTTTTLLRGGGTVGPMDISLSPLISSAYRDARINMRQQIINTNPFIQEDIADFRTKAILQAHPSLNETRFNESDFFIVGLTQRNKRRKWLNLQDSVNRCNKLWFRGDSRRAVVVCIEVNVESNKVHPITQAIMHAACDMLVGIHGAQLTEGIWLKDGSTVVELLPWLPPGEMYGSWTRTTHKPTPLGEIFHETRLNHIGYQLERDSAPYCLSETAEEKLRNCMMAFFWDDRDYQVKPEIVHDMITKFLPVDGTSNFISSPLSCDEWQRRAGDKQYVLYNVFCLDDNNNASVVPSVHHYYWPAETS